MVLKKDQKRGSMLKTYSPNEFVGNRGHENIYRGYSASFGEGKERVNKNTRSMYVRDAFIASALINHIRLSELSNIGVLITRLLLKV